MAESTFRGVPLSTLCPKFLHTNSTSHTWPFSAIAELIDNAYDPDVNATKFWIDKTLVKEKEECLSFMDNGNGLDYKTMLKMLSFGYSDKKALDGKEPIGMYGNGFKSGSMRLGRDAIVFSKSETSSCVGMLSQTYLEQIGAEQIIVPIVCFEQGDNDELNVKEEHKACLQEILRYSPFKTQKDLLFEISVISSSWSLTKTGTRIIIWNLRRTSTGNVEFDFETDRYDIRIPSDVYETMNDAPQNPAVTSNVPESVYSLQAYCSILYLKPWMQIIIRGNKVKSQLIAKTLAHVRKDHYKPTFLNNRVPIIFGYNTKSKDLYGIMMYHKNRLIKAYERVGCQIKASNKGVGVIGVIECNFLDPTHNKQSFIESDKYRKTMNSLATKLEEYWQEIRHKKNTEDPNSIPVEDTVKRPDQNWVQCDACNKWRKLPDGIDCDKLPDKWYCYMNPDHQFRTCKVEQEPVDSDDETRSSYPKTYKAKEREEKKNREMKKQKEEEERKRQEEQRLADLARQNKVLKRQQRSLRRQLLHQSPNSPSTSTTPRSRFRTETPEGGAATAEHSIISQAACSPSSNSGFPVVSDVYSLSSGTVRGKRALPVTPQTTPKRAKVNGSHLVASDTSASMDVSPSRTPSVPVNDDDDDTDDDISILENCSTPKPQKTGFDLTKVKTEQEESDKCVLLQRGDDAALDDTSDMNFAEMGSVASPSAGTSPSPASPSVLMSTTTQTEAHIIKKEEEDQSQTEWQAGREQISDAEINIGFEQREIKQESNEDTHGDSHGKQTLQKGLTSHLNSEDDAGPSFADACDERGSSLHSPSVLEVQEQQDQLIELMQATAQERDSFKQQVSVLTSELKDMQSKLQELSRITEKEISSKASQTEEAEGGEDYKSLFEKAKQKVNELIQEKESLLTSAEIQPNAVKDEEKDIDEIALQVDSLLRELNQINREKDELRSQVDSLEEERANLATRCEELRMSLQQQIENAQEESTNPHRTTDSSMQTDAEEAEGAVGTDTCSDSDTTRSLIDLRHNVGRLLVSYVIPALDLSQVNYECNVIDEILEQFLSSRSYEESDGMASLRDEGMNT